MNIKSAGNQYGKILTVIGSSETICQLSRNKVYRDFNVRKEFSIMKQSYGRLRYNKSTFNSDKEIVHDIYYIYIYSISIMY